VKPFPNLELTPYSLPVYIVFLLVGSPRALPARWATLLPEHNHYFDNTPHTKFVAGINQTIKISKTFLLIRPLLKKLKEKNYRNPHPSFIVIKSNA